MKKVVFSLFFLLLFPLFLYSSTASSLYSNNVKKLIKEGHFKKALIILKNTEGSYFLKGLCHINLLEYKKALNNFLKAINKENDNKEAFYYTGLCYYKLQDFKNAKKFFNKSYDSNVKKDESLFFLGLSDFYIGNYQKALNYFGKVENSYINEAKYFKALCEMHLGKKKHAIILLKEILKNNPESYLQNNIYEKLSQISEHKLYITLYSSVSFDSNVLREPKSSTSKSSDKSDVYNEVYLNLREKFSITEAFDINPEFTFYKSTYKRESNYNLAGFSLGPNFEFITEKFLFYLKPFYENYYLDGKNYQKNIKILSEIYLNNCNKNYFNIKFLTGRKNFYKYSDKDCYFFNVFLNQLIKFKNGTNKLGISFGAEKAHDENYSFTSIGLNEGLTTYINEYFILKTNLHYEYRDYENSKWEQTFQTVFNLTYMKLKFFQIGIDLKFLKNFSNFSQYDYNLFQSTLYLSFNY